MPGSQEELAVLMDATSLLTHILSKLSSSPSSANNEKSATDVLQLALDGLYSVLSAQPLNFRRHPPLHNLLQWVFGKFVLKIFQYFLEPNWYPRSFVCCKAVKWKKNLHRCPLSANYRLWSSSVAWAENRQIPYHPPQFSPLRKRRDPFISNEIHILRFILFFPD